MVHFRSEALFPSGILWRRPGAANIAGYDLAVGAQFGHRPDDVIESESTTFPIRDRVFPAQAIQIDGDVDIRAGQFPRELREALPPVPAENCAAPLLVGHRAIIRPGMNLEPAFAFGATIPEDLPGPPALEITATPDDNFTNQRKL